LEESFVLIDSGLTHHSGDMHRDQTQRSDGNGLLATVAERQKEITREMKKLLLRGQLHDYGRLLDESWRCKRDLNPLISSNGIDAIYDRAISHRAVGGKLLGAGGGGFFLFFVQPFHRYAFAVAMEREGYRSQRLFFDE